MPRSGEKKRVSVHMSPTEVARLLALPAAKYTSLSGLIRRAVLEMLDREANKETTG